MYLHFFITYTISIKILKFKKKFSKSSHFYEIIMRNIQYKKLYVYRKIFLIISLKF